MRYGVCCIVLGLEPRRFQTMTYASFSRMERGTALSILGDRILNNLAVTLEAVRFCHERNYCYRLSSDLFPLVTYEKAAISLEELPNHGLIYRSLAEIRTYVSDNPTRISCHPDQFNVLASENEESVGRTIRELNFQSWVMDQMGCSADYYSPMNIHLGNNKGARCDIVDRFVGNLHRLDPNCRARLVLENDDKPACWSVRLLMDHYHQKTGRPITFDYLHHKCHPDGLEEAEAIKMCHSTWPTTPLFHYSESRDEKNPRSHSDSPVASPETHGLDFDLDFEFKLKDRAIQAYESKSSVFAA
jgi:UV DNA damage endonuclease